MQARISGACLVMAAWGAASGQTPQRLSTFDAASLKPAASGQSAVVPLRGGPGSADPGLVTARGIQLRSLLQRAYQLKADQVLGPDWIGSERYDLSAKVPAGATKEQVDAMLQNLLMERFHLTLHHEARTFSGYQLGVAKNGAKLREAEAPAAGGRGCSCNIGGGHAHVACRGESMADFADVLGTLTSRLSPGLPLPPDHVVDRTDLTRVYDFTLDYGVSTGADGLADGADLIHRVAARTRLEIGAG